MQLHAIETTSGNNGSQDVTSSVSWTSSNEHAATINASGLVSAGALGSTTITAILNKATGSLPVSVTAPVATGLTIAPQNAAIYTNGTQQYKATQTYSNQTSGAVSAAIAWSASPATVVKISSSGLLTALAPGGFTVTATTDGLQAVGAGIVSNPTLTSIAINPANASVVSDSTKQFTATGTYNDKSTRDLTSAVTWTSSNLSALAIAANGLATTSSNNPGNISVVLSAQLGTVSAVTSVTVTPASAVSALYITPTSSSIANGSAEQHSAIAWYANGTQQDVTSSVAWSVSNSAPTNTGSSGEHLRKTSTGVGGKNGSTPAGVVTVAPTGIDSATTPGIATLQAKLGAQQSTSIVIVTPATVTGLSVNASKSLFPIGSTQQVQLIGSFSDGTHQDLSLTANWTSNNPAIATISSAGIATAIAAGPVTFSASFGGLSASSSGMEVLPQTLVSTVIKADYPLTAAGASQQLELLGTYTDGSTHDLTSQASWQSADSSIVRVESTGLAYGIGQGTAQITGTVFGVSAIASITSEPVVLQSIQVLPVYPSFALGTTVDFTALGVFNGGFEVDVSHPAIWRSADPNVLTIDSTGRAKAGSVGTTTITASLLGQTGTSTPVQVTNTTLSRLRISPASAQMAATTGQQYTAMGIFNDGSTQDITPDVVWTTSDATVAAIDGEGLAFGIKAGTVEVNARFEGQSDSAILTVTNASLVSVAVSPDSSELPVGMNRQFSFTGTFSDGTTQDFSADPATVWTPPTPSIVTVILNGQVTGLAPGVGQIAAQRGNFSASTSVNVTNATLSSVSLAPSFLTLRQGQQQQLTANGIFSDGYTQNLFGNAVFATNNRRVVDVGEPGLAFATGIGSTQITATFRGQVATSAVQVLDATLSAIVVSPSSPTLNAGGTTQLTATGTYLDGTTANVSSSVVWTSSNPAVLNVDENGLLTAYATTTPVSVTVTASGGGASKAVVVTLSPAGTPPPAPTLTAVTVLPTSSRVAAGTAAQLIARGTYSDGSTQDLSSSVTWSSPNSGLATVSSSGVAIGVAPGTVNIQTASGSIHSQATLVVSGATLTSVTVSPSGPSFAGGAPQQVTLTGNFSDGSSQNLNASATWTTSAPGVAVISAAGLITGVAAGTAVVTGSSLGHSATTTVTITPATLIALTITPPNAAFADGTAQQFTVLGTYSDGTTHDVTSGASFTSTNPAILKISAGGLAQGILPGSAQLAASFAGQTAATQAVTVTPATLVSLAITPQSPSFADGSKQPFVATATFSDGTTENLTSQVVWTSSSPAVLTIDQNGDASSGSTGSAQVTATFAGVSTATGMVQVTAAVLTGLTITPTSAQIAKGTGQQFMAIGTYSDGSTENLSSMVAWSSSSGAVTSINANGLASASGVGSAQVTATYQGHSASTSSFQVTAATLVSIAFNPASPSVAAGVGAQVTVTGTFSDGSTQNLSGSASYASSNPAAATVNNTGVVTGLAPGTSTVTVQVDGMTSSFSVTVTNAVLSSIAIAPGDPVNFAKGTSQQFTATGTYSDGSMQNISSVVGWSSSNAAFVTVNASGLAAAAAIGSAQITASYQGRSATTPAFQVLAASVASLAVTPANGSIAVAGTQQFTAIATFTDASTMDVTSTAAWSSSSTGVASILPSAGLATAIAIGSTTITAQLNGVSNFVTLTIATAGAPNPTLTSLTITPTSSRIAAGTTTQFSATGGYSDGSTQNLSSTVTWTSTNNGVATINTSGTATGVSQGAVTVGAQSGSITSQATLIVSPATLTSVALSPSGPSLAAGGVQQLTLTGTFSDGSTQNLSASATWTSLAPAVATVSTTGLVTGVDAGTAQMSAVYQSMTATTSVTVTPATLVSLIISPLSPSFADGTTRQFTVTGEYSDGSTSNVTSTATFSSTNPSVVTVSNAGLAMGISPGTAQVIASFGGQTATTASVTVTAATLVSITITPNSPTFADGTTQQFTATGTYSDGSAQNLSSQVVWSSSSPAVLTVNASGNASGGSPGSAEISATFNGVNASTGTIQVTPAVLTSLSIAPTSAQIAKGTSQQFTATGTYSDGSTQNLSSTVAWSSSNGSVVSVNASGLAVGSGTGSAQVTATYQGQTISTSSFQVTPATLASIAFSPANPSVAAGTGEPVVVTGTFSDGTTQDLSSSASYSSSNSSAVAVSNSGLVTGVAPGSSTITVLVDGMTSSFNVTVTSATLSSIAITPANPANFAKGTTQQLTATGTYSDGSTQNLSSTVTWSSSNSTAASVNGTGLITGSGVGTAQITAFYQGQSATTQSFQVTAATMASIAVTPATASIVVGATEQYTATATYTDATTQNVSSSVTWSSSSAATATINASSGLASGLAAGSTTISAQLNSLSNSVSLMVTPAPAVTLTSITVTPSSATVAKGNTQQFTAFGNYSDGSTQSLTALVTWQSSVPSVATIDNNGLATSVAGGNTQIWATYQGQSTAVAFTVSAATLVSLAVTPANASLSNGTSQQYQAVGTLSDGSTQNLTSSVTWSSNNSAVATVNSSGFCSTHAVGSAVITAQAGSPSGTATLTVTSATAVSLQFSPSTVSLPAGGFQQLQVTATFSDGSSQNVTSSVTYGTTNHGVATASAAGNLQAVETGTATVTATLGAINANLPVTVTAATLTSLAIAPQNPSLAAGSSLQLTATGTFSDGSTQNLTQSVTWNSSTQSVASVSSTGNVVIAHTGTTSITAASGSVFASDAVTGTSAVVTAISVSPASATLASGQTQQFAATATLSDGSQQTITTSTQWSVSVPADGSISNSAGSNGLLTTSATGSFNVTATENSVSGSATVTVQPATLSSLAITPGPVSVPAGTTQALTTTGTYSDGSTANLNGSAVWSSASDTIATVNTSGLLDGVSSGQTTVTSTVQSHSANVSVTVTSALLSSISITPASPSLALGLQTQLTATGHYTDGSTANVTSQVQWTSATQSVATISNTGLVSTLATGTSTLTATLNSVSQQTVLTVTAAVLQSISVQASQTSFALGLNLQLAAIGTYSDSSSQNLTSTVTWSSQSPNVGVVSSTGLASGVSTGTFNARATQSGITGSLTITVSSAALQSITVTPVNQTVVNLLGNTIQYTATGHFSDGSTQNITSSVHWALGSGLILASISQSGVFSPLGVGIGTVTATSGAIVGSTNFIIVAI